MKYAPRSLAARMLALGGLLFVSAAALAQSYSTTRPILSGYRDTSNLSFSQTLYRFDFSRAESDAATYINGFELVPGADWDSDLQFNLPTTTVNSGQGDEYTLGTPLVGDQFREFRGIATHFGAVNPDVAAGIYSFQLRVIGGGNATAADELAVFDLQYEVTERLDVTVMPLLSAPQVAQGGTFDAGMNVAASGSRAFVSESWYRTVPGFAMGGIGMDGAVFTGNWFDQTVAPGTSRTDEHSRYTVAANQALGVYESSYGVIGGLYDGDEHLIEALPKARIEVVAAVPEPATLAGLALGALALSRRRRK